MRLFKICLTAAMVLGAPALAAAEGDAAKGGKVFKKCASCHFVDSDKNKVGPSLQGVIGRTAGSVEGFKYSKAMKAAGEGGLVWDEAALTEFLAKPKKYMKGTKMGFAGLKKDKDIANVIAYLKQSASAE